MENLIVRVLNKTLSIQDLLDYEWDNVYCENNECEVIREYIVGKYSTAWNSWINNTNTNIDVILVCKELGDREDLFINNLISFSQKTPTDLDVDAFIYITSIINLDDENLPLLFPWFRLLSTDKFHWMLFEDKYFESFLKLSAEFEFNYLERIKQRKPWKHDFDISMIDWYFTEEQLKMFLVNSRLDYFYEKDKPVAHIIKKLLTIELSEKENMKLIQFIKKLGSNLYFRKMLTEGVFNDILDELKDDIEISLLNYGVAKYMARYENYTLIDFVLLHFPNYKPLINYYFVRNGTLNIINTYFTYFSQSTIDEIARDMIKFIS